MSKQYKTVSLSDEQRIALEALCRILDIGPTVLTEWRFAFAGAGLSVFGLKDYGRGVT
jgi:hypothetical protein